MTDDSQNAPLPIRPSATSSATGTPLPESTPTIPNSPDVPLDRSEEPSAMSKSKEKGPEASHQASTSNIDSEHSQSTPQGNETVTQQRPLQLLDLPIDVLKEIVREISAAHASDLTALALTHPVLHTLAIPHIYSRFDIVWPDPGITSDSRSGVDALTYGLATLVMSGNLFEPYAATTRRGNYYADYTKKFSLGNGPPDWVQEYMVFRESGKMLGTLVAIAIARMRNLESFIWICQPAY